jgi:hypothetical protein
LRIKLVMLLCMILLALPVAAAQTASSSKALQGDIAVLDDDGNVVDVVSFLDVEPLPHIPGNVELRERLIAGNCQPLYNSVHKEIGAKLGNEKLKNVCALRKDYLPHTDFYEKEYSTKGGANYPEVLHKFSCTGDGGLISEVVRCVCGEHQGANSIGTCSDKSGDILPVLIAASPRAFSNGRVIAGNKESTLGNALLFEEDVEFVRDLPKSNPMSLDISFRAPVALYNPDYISGKHQFLQLGEYDEVTSYRVKLSPGSEPFRGNDNFKEGETYVVVFKDHLDKKEPVYFSDHESQENNFLIDPSYKEKIPPDIEVKIANYNAKQRFIEGDYTPTAPLYPGLSSDPGAKFSFEGQEYSYNGFVQKGEVYELTFSTPGGKVKKIMTKQAGSQFGETFLNAAGRMIYIESVGDPKRDPQIIAYLPPDSSKPDEEEPEEPDIPFVPPTGNIIWLTNDLRDPVQIHEAKDIWTEPLPVSSYGNLHAEAQLSGGRSNCAANPICWDNRDGYQEFYLATRACVQKRYICDDCSSKTCQIKADKVVKTSKESYSKNDRKDTYITKERLAIVKQGTPTRSTGVLRYGEIENDIWNVQVTVKGNPYTVVWSNKPKYNYEGKIYNEIYKPDIGARIITGIGFNLDIVKEVERLLDPPDPEDTTDPRNDPDYVLSTPTPGAAAKLPGSTYTIADLRDAILRPDDGNLGDTSVPFHDFLNLYSDLIEEGRYDEIKTLYDENPEKFFDPIEEAAEVIAGELEVEDLSDISPIIEEAEKSTLSRAEKDAIINLIAALGSSTELKNAISQMTGMMWFNILSNDPVREIIGQENFEKIVQEKYTLDALWGSILVDYSRPPDAVLIAEGRRQDFYNKYDIEAAANYYGSNIKGSSYDDWVKNIWVKALNEMLALNQVEIKITENIEVELRELEKIEAVSGLIRGEETLKWMAANVFCGGPLLATGIYSFIDKFSGHPPGSPYNTLDLIKDQRSYQIWFGEDHKEYPWYEQTAARLGICGYFALGAVSAQAGTMGTVGRTILGAELALDATEAVSMHNTFVGNSEFKKEVQWWMLPVGYLAVFVDIPGIIAPMRQSAKVGAKVLKAANGNAEAAVQIWESAVKEGFAVKTSKGTFELVAGKQQKFDLFMEEVLFTNAKQENNFYPGTIHGLRSVSGLAEHSKKGNVVMFSGSKTGGASLVHIGKTSGPRDAAFEMIGSHFRHSDRLVEGDVKAYVNSLEGDAGARGHSGSYTVAHLDTEGHLVYSVGGSNELFKVTRDGVEALPSTNQALGQQALLGAHKVAPEILESGEMVVSVSEGVIRRLASEGVDIKEIIRTNAGKGEGAIADAIATATGKQPIADESIGVLTYKGKKTGRALPIVPGTANSVPLKPGLLQDNPDYQAEVLEAMQQRLRSMSSDTPGFQEVNNRVREMIRQNEFVRKKGGDVPKLGLYSHSTDKNRFGGIVAQGQQKSAQIIKQGHLKKSQASQGYGTFLSTKLEDLEYGDVAFVFTEGVEKVKGYTFHGLAPDGVGSWHRIGEASGSVPVIGEVGLDFEHLAYITYSTRKQKEGLMEALQARGLTGGQAERLLVHKDAAKLEQEILQEAIIQINPAKQVKRGVHIPTPKKYTIYDLEDFDTEEIFDNLVHGEVIRDGGFVGVVIEANGKKYVQHAVGGVEEISPNDLVRFSFTDKRLNGVDLINLKTGDKDLAEMLARQDFDNIPPVDDFGRLQFKLADDFPIKFTGDALSSLLDAGPPLVVSRLEDLVTEGLVQRVEGVGRITYIGGDKVIKVSKTLEEFKQGKLVENPDLYSRYSDEQWQSAYSTLGSGQSTYEALILRDLERSNFGGRYSGRIPTLLDEGATSLGKHFLVESKVAGVDVAEFLEYADDAQRALLKEDLTELRNTFGVSRIRYGDYHITGNVKVSLDADGSPRAALTDFGLARRERDLTTEEWIDLEFRDEYTLDQLFDQIDEAPPPTKPIPTPNPRIHFDDETIGQLEAIVTLRRNEPGLVLGEGEVFVHHKTLGRNLEAIVTSRKLDASLTLGYLEDFEPAFQAQLQGLIPGIRFDRANSVYATPTIYKEGIENIHLKVKVHMDEAYVQDLFLTNAAFEEFKRTGSISRRTVENAAGSTMTLREFLENYKKDGQGYKRKILANKNLPEVIHTPEVLIPRDVPIEDMTVGQLSESINDLMNSHGVENVDELLARAGG